jgi:hypothetical protein
MKKKTPSVDTGPRFDTTLDSFTIGPAYLDYCVKKGWLTKVDDSEPTRYELTELGRKKLDNVSLNFDLSTISAKGDDPKKKRKRQKK